MPEFISVMSLGDIFDRTFKLIGKTFVRNIIIALLLNLPAFILILLGGQLAISTASDMIARWEHATPEIADVIRLFVFPALLFGLAAIVASVAYVWSFMAIYLVVGKHMNEEPITWQEALSRSGSRLLSGIGFEILVGLAITAIIFIPYAVMIGGFALEENAIGVLGVLLFFIGIVFVVYLSVRWLFGLNAIAWEDAGVMEAFRRSSELVKGRWWRTFGIILLLGIIASFAVSLVASPVLIIGLVGPYIDLFSHIANETDPGPAVIMNLVTGLFYGYVLSIAVTVILQMVIEPVYTMVLYFDNRARNGEFEDETPPAPTDPDDSARLGEDWQNVSV